MHPHVRTPKEAPFGLFSFFFMATTTQVLYAPEKFKGEGYALWKFKMELFLREKELWEVAQGMGKPVSVDAASAAALAAWEVKATKAKTAICLALADNQLIKVMNTRDGTKCLF